MCARAIEHAEAEIENQDQDQQLHASDSTIEEGATQVATPGRMDASLSAVTEQPSPIPTDRPLAIKTENLARTYKVKGQKRSSGDKEKGKEKAEDKKTLVALAGVDLEVYQGELFGLL